MGQSGTLSPSPILLLDGVEEAIRTKIHAAFSHHPKTFFLPSNRPGGVDTQALPSEYDSDSRRN